MTADISLSSSDSDFDKGIEEWTNSVVYGIIESTSLSGKVIAVGERTDTKMCWGLSVDRGLRSYFGYFAQDREDRSYSLILYIFDGLNDFIVPRPADYQCKYNQRVNERPS